MDTSWACQRLPASRTQGKLAVWHRSVKSPCVKRAEYQARPQHLFSNVRGFCPDLVLSLAGISSFPLLPPKWGQTPCMVSSVSVCQLPFYSHSSQRFCALESDVPWERALLTSSPASFCVQTPPKPCPAMALQIHLAKDKILLSPPLCNDWHRCLIQGLGSQVLRWAKVVFVHPIPLVSVLGALRKTN